MDKNKIPLKDILKKLSKGRLLLSAVIIVFVAGVIVIYNILLLNSVSENMNNTGQISAERSAKTVDTFLYDCSNSLAIVEFTLDNMIVSGASDEEILEFIIQQDASLKNMINSETTKLYSLIGGRIFDGSEKRIRIPDYVPAERPWYREAMADKGNFVLVDPCSDIHTGNTLMTIAKTMSDGESIVMFDVSLERIQQVIEDHSTGNANITAMVLDSSFSVVAHTDTGELGKSYIGEGEDSIGAAIISMISDNSEQCFSLSYGGHGYTVYIVPVHGSWYSISVVATADEYMPIRIMFMISVIVSIAILASIVLIIIRSGRREILAKRLNDQLSSAADIYMSLSDIDLINMKVIQIKDYNPRFIMQFAPDVNDVQGTFRRIMDSMPESPTKQAAIDFVDLSTLEERIADKGSITLEYLSHGHKWVRGRFVESVRTPEGRLSHVLWMLEDIDEEKRTRDILSQKAEKLTSQLSSAADIYISLCDLDIRDNSVVAIKNANPAIAKAVDACDHNMQDIFFGIMRGLPESPTKQAAIDFCDLSDIDEKMADKNTLTCEYLSYGNIWVRGRYVVSERDENGKITHVLWMLENIDKEKKDREKLIDLSERAVAANEAKSAFLSNMSHEIRTPINAVLGMNEMVLRECDDPAVITYSESIRTAGTTLLGLINDILDFSKIEAGKMEIIPVDYDLATVLSDLVNMIQTRLDNKGLMLVTEFDPSMPHLLHGDEVRIKQVITNILTNAVKYTETGSVTFRAGFERIDGEPDSVMICVAIKDTGIGIKAEDMAKLFSKFERIEEERNRTIEGTGLGMSITQSLLTMMGSKLDVESVYGEGSTFGFRLKQQVRKWDELGNYEEAHRSSIASRKKYHEKFTAPDAHILVVDDTVMNLLVFTSLLKSTQVKIDTAESGDDGIALAMRNKYDIIFLDHMMPKKDGIETLHEMRAAENDPNRDTPVICLTANAISGAREKYLDAGFDDYLTKPIESAKLEEMIVEYLPPEKIKASVALKPKAPPKAAVPDRIFSLTELDTVSGIKNAGSEAQYLENLKAYAEMMNGYIDDTADYWLGGDITNLGIKLHSLKGASRTVGAEWIRRSARELENACSEGDADTVNSGMEDLLLRCRALGASINAAISAAKNTKAV
ncbi:MAG: response regulator [Ruminiclostridium sp.]|nr:response regulator [Ruminiclostridium sp.]